MTTFEALVLSINFASFTVALIMLSYTFSQKK